MVYIGWKQTNGRLSAGCAYNTDGATSSWLVQLIFRNKKHTGQDFSEVLKASQYVGSPKLPANQAK